MPKYLFSFLGIQKRIRINHGKRAIGVRVIEGLLYFPKGSEAEVNISTPFRTNTYAQTKGL